MSDSTTTLPTTLAAFKQWLGSGGILTLQSYHYATDGIMRGPYAHRGLGIPRVANGNTMGISVALVDADKDSPTVRLDYGPAREWKFDGNIATLNDGDTRLIYEMSTA